MARSSRQKKLARHKYEAKKQGKICPTPGKKSYLTEFDAERALEASWRKPQGGRQRPIRVYQCDCGLWHMTAKPHRPPHASAQPTIL